MRLGARGAQAEVRGDRRGHRVGDRGNVRHRLIEAGAPRNRSVLRAKEAHGQLEPIACPDERAVDHRVDTQRSPDDRRILPAARVRVDGPCRPDHELRDGTQPVDECV